MVISDQGGHQVPQSSGTANTNAICDRASVLPSTQRNQLVETPATTKPNCSTSNTSSNENKRKNSLGAGSSKKARSVANEPVVNILESDPEVVNHQRRPQSSRRANKFFKDCCAPSDDIRNRALEKLRTEHHNDEVVGSLVSSVLRETREITQIALPKLLHYLDLVKGLSHNANLNIESHIPNLLEFILKWIGMPNCCLAFSTEADSQWTIRDDMASLLVHLCNKSERDDLKPRAVTALAAILRDRSAPLESIYGTIVGLGEFGSKVVQDEIIPGIRGIGEMAESRSNMVGDSPSHDDEIFLAIFHVKCAIEEKVGPLIQSSIPPSVGIEEYKRRFGEHFGEFLFAYVNTMRVRIRHSRSSPTT